MATGYLGAKSASGAYQAIIASFPPHDAYVEAFAGTSTVLRRKPACGRTVAIDVDAAVFERWPLPSGIEQHVGDAISWLAGADLVRSRSTLVYCDPPYVWAARSSRKRYANEFTDEDHGRLAAVLRGLPCSVVVSGYPSCLYAELFEDWRTRTFQVMTRGGVRTECLWMNFPESSRLLSAFVGDGAEDRRRIKRKAARWQSNFAALPEAERNVVLAALLDVS